MDTLPQTNTIFANDAKKSHNHPILAIYCPELLGRHAPLLPERAVEIGEVVKAAAVADLGDVLGGIHERAGRDSEADVGDVEFGLREVSADKDEPPMPIGRHLMFGTLGEKPLLASLDEVSETSSE